MGMGEWEGGIVIMDVGHGLGEAMTMKSVMVSLTLATGKVEVWQVVDITSGFI